MPKGNPDPSHMTRFGGERAPRSGLGGRSSLRAKFWQLFKEAITDKDFKAVAVTFLKAAKKGEPWAVKLFFDKCLGNEVVLSSELGEGLKIIFEHRDGKGKDAG